MNSKYSINPSSHISIKKANVVLKTSTRLLFLTAVIGQWIFVWHIVSFYGSTAINGQFEEWNQHLMHGIIKGDFIGNVILAVHLFFAATLTFGGPLQFIPRIQTKFPRFHRWNGRIYIFTAFLVSIAGLYMIFSRGIVGSTITMIGSIINASLIMIFASLTIRTAMNRNFEAHRRWALRAFLMVNGVWFFRIGFGLWIFINSGSAPGSTENLDGPFDMFLAFAQSLIPLAILEFYFYAKVHTTSRGRYVLAAGMLTLTFALGAGIFMAAMIFWLP